MSEHDCSHENNEKAAFCKIHKVDPKNSELTDLQKKHAPVIKAPSKAKRDEEITVVVEVGKLLKHPNILGHHIQWIELWQREAFLARVDLTPLVTEPTVELHVKLDHPWPLIARARCNLHGIYETEVEFSIKE
ncbi:MAG: class II SORL domain-containing protein [Candidatus Ranarchaeia archaeon]